MCHARQPPAGHRRQSRNQDYCYDEHNRLTNVKTGGCAGTSVIGLGYDGQGNLANRNGTLYGFDYGNRMRTGGPESYRYDAWGRRARSIDGTGGILYSLYGQAGQLLWQRDERTQQRRNYVYLQGSLLAEQRRPIGDTTETIVYQHTDALGSPVAITNSSKTVLQRSEYEPYGYLLNRAMEDGPGYTGHATDAATGLVYMQQRYYDPVLGTFLSVDPINVDTATAWNFCRYCYADNSPYTFTDPDGRQKTVAWLVRLTAKGMQKIARVSREQAIQARRAGQNIVGDRRQISSGIETAAHGSEGQLKHAGHELKDGSKGLPHYQTEGKTGHSFWGQLSVAAAAIAGTLNQAADAAEYIPDPTPRPATQDDIARTNSIIDAINNTIGTNLPNFPDLPPPTDPQLPKPEEPKPDEKSLQ